MYQAIHLLGISSSCWVFIYVRGRSKNKLIFPWGPYIFRHFCTTYKWKIIFGNNVREYFVRLHFFEMIFFFLTHGQYDHKVSLYNEIRTQVSAIYSDEFIKFIKMKQRINPLTKLSKRKKEEQIVGRNCTSQKCHEVHSTPISVCWNAVQIRAYILRQ